jgi:hypothetical protein
MLVRICGGQDIQIKAFISTLLLLTGTTSDQAGHGPTEATPIPWQPFKMHLPSVSPPPTIPKEMVSHFKVANWPVTLEKTTLTDAQKRFGGSLGHNGDAGDYVQWLCLYNRNAEDGWVLWLTSGEIDGGSIGGFVWLRMSATQRIDSRCTELHAEQATVTLPIPLRLNTTRDRVEQLLGKPSSRFHETFTYLHEHKGTIGRTPYTWDNSIDLVYQRGLVQAIQVDLTISS